MYSSTYKERTLTDFYFFSQVLLAAIFVVVGNLLSSLKKIITCKALGK